MNTASATSQYLLLFRNTDWEDKVALEQSQQLMDRINGWFSNLAAQGIVKGGHPLFSRGVTVSGKSGSTVSDGPFVESKEIIGGYLMLAVDTMEEAVEIAKGNPLLEFGLTTEVREVADECPVYQRVIKRLEQKDTVIA